MKKRDMANIAIKGHATRGREVIELLEMLGGKNFGGHNGTRNMLFFIHPEHNEILADWCQRETHYVVFTLEEFLDKFPHKVGDRVLVKDHESPVKIVGMIWNGSEIEYRIDMEDDILTADDLQPYKEESMEENKVISDRIDFSFTNKIELDLGDTHEVIVEDSKTYVVRKKTQYPKVFGECCDVLNIWRHDAIYWYEEDLIGNFRKLLLCRDAYYKLYGKGNGKVQFVIATFDGEISLSVKDTHRNYLLSFPTSDVRDAFYENFKELIESCKEFL